VLGREGRGDDDDDNGESREERKVLSMTEGVGGSGE
jgi:hypothetical protein